MYPQEQWFLKAVDLDKNFERDFALLGVASFDSSVVKTPKIKTVPDSFVRAKLYTDGGSRGNPGPSATGYVILDMEDNVVKKEGSYLGVTTNNQAEYKALKTGLENALELGVRELEIYMDSMLVINQINGAWKIKHQELLPVYDNVKELISKFDKVTASYVPRAMNSIADSMVNECLDAQ